MRYENKCDCGRMKVAGAIACSHCYSEARVRKSMSISDMRECPDCGATNWNVLGFACQHEHCPMFAEESQEPCPVCGNEERGQGGYLSCECAARTKREGA